MAVLVSGNSLTDAWRGATGHLLPAPGGELYDLVVEVRDPSSADPLVLQAVDDHLAAIGYQSLRSVANTIFPAALAARSASRDELYARYERLLPRLRHRDARNRRGTYFARLIHFPLQDDPDRWNQIERVIHNLGLAPGRPMRHIYEMQIFAPGVDLRPEGFPCLSSVSIHLHDGAIRLAATYRNQYFVERGLGNFMGLADLQRYIAEQTGLPIGALSVHAFHAVADGPRRQTRQLLDQLADV
jgi:hypothetical protein